MPEINASANLDVDLPAIDIPCPALPKIPELPSITLLGGAELQGFLDFTQGPPTDCKITLNLMLQLSPVLASMACLLKLMNAMVAIKDLVTGLPDLSKVGDVVKAIEELTGCIPALVPLQVVLMLKAIIDLIISFLSCFLSQLESIINFQNSIDLTVANGNPVLLSALNCAKNNGQTQMDNLMLSLNPIQPIMKMVGMVAGIIGKEIALPDLSSIGALADAQAVITSINSVVLDLKKVSDALG